jgi:hypothetical protein
MSDVPDAIGSDLEGVLLWVVRRGLKNAKHGQGMRGDKEPHVLSQSGKFEVYTDCENVRVPILRKTRRSPDEKPVNRQPRRAKHVLEYEESLYGVVSLIRGLSEENTESLAYWCTPKILDHLFQIGSLAHSNSAILPAVYNCITMIIEAVPEIPIDVQHVMEKRMKETENMDKWRPARKVAIFPVFAKQLLPRMTDFFFQEPPFSDAFNSCFLDTIKKLTVSERYDFLSAQNDQFLRTLVIRFPAVPGEGEGEDVAPINGQVIHCALFLADPDQNKAITPFMRDTIWTDFVVSRLAFYRAVELDECLPRHE